MVDVGAAVSLAASVQESEPGDDGDGEGPPVLSAPHIGVSNRLKIDNHDLPDIGRHTAASNRLAIDNLDVLVGRIWFYSTGRDTEISERFPVDNLEDTPVLDWSMYE